MQLPSRWPTFGIAVANFPITQFLCWPLCDAKARIVLLRLERVVAFVEEGHSHRSAATRFQVSVKFVNDMVILKRETGGLEPRAQGRGPGQTQPQCRDALLPIYSMRISPHPNPKPPACVAARWSVRSAPRQRDIRPSVSFP